MRKGRSRDCSKKSVLSNGRHHTSPERGTPVIAVAAIGILTTLAHIAAICHERAWHERLDTATR